jgi:AcrR family transcriptional regulator
LKQLIRIWRQRYSKTVNCEPALLPAASLPAMATRIRTRLPPATRREEILDAAGRLFAERGYAAVSASEVAREAGVTPGLLHHYFGGKRGLFVTLVERLAPKVVDVIRVDATRPVYVRTRSFATSWFDWVDANRQIWLATGGLDEDLPDPELRTVVDAIRERVIDSLIADYPATLSDEPRIRLMLRSFLAYNRVVVRSWLDGQASRADAERLLADTLRALITTIAPKLAQRSEHDSQGSVG